MKESMLRNFAEFVKKAGVRLVSGFGVPGEGATKTPSPKPSLRSRGWAKKANDKDADDRLRTAVDSDSLTLVHALVSGGPAGLETLKELALKNSYLMRDRLFESGRSESLSVAKARLEAIKKRLAGLSNADAWGVQGKTPLMIAVSREWKEGVDFLLPLSDLKACDEFRQGLLTQALQTRLSWEWVIDLCDPNETGDLGMTALMTAVQRRNKAGAAALLHKSKCDANARTQDGYTALALAAAAGKLDLTTMLIRATNPENRTSAFKEVLRRLEASRGEGDDDGEEWACLDALSPFVEEKDADRAYLIARGLGLGSERMPFCAARMEAGALRAEIGLKATATRGAEAMDPRPFDEPSKSEEIARSGKSSRL